MARPADQAARRRDHALARTRRLTLWAASSAATASLGLGAVFAHTLPGHRAPIAAAQPGSAEPRTAQTTPRAGGAPASPAMQQPTSGASAAPSPAATRLSQPSQAPAATPAPAQTASGGS